MKLAKEVCKPEDYENNDHLEKGFVNAARRL
jgi:hypothetical protein